MSTRRRTPSERRKTPLTRLVAPAQGADRRRHADPADDVEAERREVLAGADRERERERGDEDDRGDDLPRALAQLARPVEAVSPEHEQQHEDQEGEPVGLGDPEQVPEDRLGIADQRSGARARGTGRRSSPVMSMTTSTKMLASPPQRRPGAGFDAGRRAAPTGRPRAKKAARPSRARLIA